MNTPHRNGSLSYRTIDSRVKRSLDSRSNLNNTQQVAMPFVKVSSTLNRPELLGYGNYGFTIGLHAIDEDVRYEDIYSNQRTGGSDLLVGYTYSGLGNTRVYTNANILESNDSSLINSVFDNGIDLFSSTPLSMIPPPGITGFNVGTNRQGYTIISDISINVPHLTQLEILQQSFLIPGMGIILEWGNSYASDLDISESQLNTDAMFPWYDKNKFVQLCERLARKKVGIEEILEDYVWPNNGNYMWMYGQIANFNMKARSDGSYEVTAKIIGPNEGSWAYQTVNTVVPPRLGDVVCASSTNSVETFFRNTSRGKNLKSLLDNTIGIETDPWNTHVLKFTRGNLSEGEGEPGDGREPNASQGGFGDSEDAYFMSWRFFVNVVLNDPNKGILSIFNDAGLTEDELEKIKTLRKYKDVNNTPEWQITMDDPYESFVGSNEYLRSINPGVMIIVNDTAADAAIDDLTKNRADITDELTQETELSRQFKLNGNFDFYSNEVVNRQQYGGATSDKGLLSTGVWLNHKAVVQAMLSSDTILGGIVNLLNAMNQASAGFWKLTIDTSDPMFDDAGEVLDDGINYSVIDANFRDNSDYAVSTFIEDVHLFNKYIRSDGGTIVGSDVMKCDVNLDLPARLFAQIGTLGLTQPNDSDENQTDHPILSVNDTLRKMFSIASISEKNVEGQTIDFTHISQAQRRQERLNNTVCTGTSGQVTAGLAGTGAQVTNANAADLNTNTSTGQLERIKEEQEEILNSDDCTSDLCADSVRTAVVATENGNEVVTGAASGEERPIAPNTVGYTDNFGNFQSVTIDYNYLDNIGTTGRELYNAGYRNGRLSPEDVRSLSVVGTPQNPNYVHSLYRKAAQDFERMKDAAEEAGYTITINDSYRRIEAQIDLIYQTGFYNGYGPAGTDPGSPGKASTPGRSKHGWGIALDINVGGATGALFGWLRANGSRYNFSAVLYDNDGREPWHWVWTGEPDLPLTPPTIPPTPGAPTAQYQTENLPAARQPVPEGCERCVLARQLLDQVEVLLSRQGEYDAGKDALVREFPQLNRVFRYVEPFMDHMVANITRTSDSNRSNAFGAAPGGLSISATIDLAGINGFRVGELFWIDRIPTFYKAFGAFQILSYQQKISQTEWTTTINARYNFLGKSWKESMYERLSQKLLVPSYTNYNEEAEI